MKENEVAKYMASKNIDDQIYSEHANDFGISFNFGWDGKEDQQIIYQNKTSEYKFYDPLDDLKSNNFIILVETPIEALTIRSAFYKYGKNKDHSVGIIALKNNDGLNDFISFFDHIKNKNLFEDSFIFMFKDNEFGYEAHKSLKQYFEDHKDLTITYTSKNVIQKEYDDISKFYLADEKGCVKALSDIMHKFPKYSANESKYERKYEKGSFKDEKAKFITSKSNTALMDLFTKEIEEATANKGVKTLFNNIDNLFGGSIAKGLITIGAPSSVGKTALIMQIAEQIAMSRQANILIFSLEMRRSELIARSLSRISKILNINDQSNKALEEISVLRNYNADNKASIDEAIRFYKSYAHRIFIEEGFEISRNRAKDNANAMPVTINDIIEISHEYKKKLGEAPIIIIDYLQLVKTPNPQYEDKTTMDAVVLALKQLQADLNTTLICISSMPRSAYNSLISMSSLKESGIIEYSSDIVLGLTYTKIIDYIKTHKTKDGSQVKEATQETIADAENENIKELTLTTLKNRHGAKNYDGVSLKFNPQFMLFTDGLTSEKTLMNYLNGSIENTSDTYEEWNKAYNFEIEKDLPF